MLRNYAHSRKFFTPKIHSAPTTWPATPHGPPTHPARNLPDRQPNRARHPSWPAYPACLPSLPSCPSSSGTTASRALRSASAVPVLLQRLHVWDASQSATHSTILHILLTTPNILCTPETPLRNSTYPMILSNILCTTSKILRIPSYILHIPRTPTYILRTPFNILMDTRSAWSLPPGVVNC